MKNLCGQELKEVYDLWELVNCWMWVPLWLYMLWFSFYIGTNIHSISMGEITTKMSTHAKIWLSHQFLVLNEASKIKIKNTDHRLCCISILSITPPVVPTVYFDGGRLYPFAHSVPVFMLPQPWKTSPPCATAIALSTFDGRGLGIREEEVLFRQCFLMWLPNGNHLGGNLWWMRYMGVAVKKALSLSSAVSLLIQQSTKSTNNYYNYSLMITQLINFFILM